jgi:hypothetical protein
MLWQNTHTNCEILIIKGAFNICSPRHRVPFILRNEVWVQNPFDDVTCRAMSASA